MVKRSDRFGAGGSQSALRREVLRQTSSTPVTVLSEEALARNCRHRCPGMTPCHAVHIAAVARERACAAAPASLMGPRLVVTN